MVVGEIPVSHQVLPNGSTSYTVPIECAPGRAGVQPSITLSYNSLGGNGVAGYGWNIGGLSAIQRTVSSYYYDGSAKGTEMTATANFVLDGVRLIQNSSSSTLRTFVPEQGNIRIEAFMNGAVTKYFKVWYSNGTTAIYGYDTNTAVNKLLYPVTSITDILGNTIKFTYDELNNHYYIKEIKYGSSKTITNDFASIKFEYKTRTDVSSLFEAGLEITETRLLNYIQCINNNTVIRTYNFTYTFNRVSLLTQIGCNLLNGSLNPLKFYYGTNNPQTQFTKSSSQLTNWFNVSKLVTSKGKFDLWDDDEDALISYPKLCPYVEYQSGSDKWYQSEYNPNQSLLVYPGLYDSWVLPATFTAGDGFMELTSGDVDGKAGEELIKINNLVSGTSDNITFTMYKPSGIGVYYTYKTSNYSPMTALDVRGRKSITPKEFIVGDFAGIGRMQVLALSRYNPLGLGNATKIMVFDIETGNTLCNMSLSGFNFNGGDFAFAIDYDGDGRAEICHIHSAGTDIYAFSGTTTLSLSKVATITGLCITGITSRKLMVGDINGDGKTDLLLSPFASYEQSYWATIPVSNHRYCPNCRTEYPGTSSCRKCQAYLPPSDWCIGCNNSLSYCYNGQNYELCCPNHGTHIYTEITEYTDNGNEWTVYYSKGSNGFEKKTQALIPHDQSSSGKLADYILHDLNNDGKADLVRSYLGSISVYPSLGMEISSIPEPAYTNSAGTANLIPTIIGKGVYHAQMLTVNNGASVGTVDKFSFSRNDTRERMMSGAVNSFGVVIKSEYKQLNDTVYPAIYQSGSGAVFPFDDFNAYLWATAETQTWYNNNQKAGNSYYYTQAKIHRQGRGFLGFETFSVTDNRGRTVTQTFRPVDFGILMKEESPVSLIENLYSVSLNSDKSVVIQPTQQKTTDLLKNIVTTTKYTSYNSYSQPLVIETEYGLNSGVKTKREYIYSNTNTSTAYVLGLPTEEKITNTRSGSSWIDKTTISYNSAFLPSVKTTFTGASGTLQTGYETFNYDSEGNLTNRSFKPYSSTNTLSASYTYDSNKRFVMTETNAINLTTTYGYDSFGRLASSINHLNQTTNYYYDDLNRQNKVTYPDGVYETTTFSWESQNGLYSIRNFQLGKPWKQTCFDAFGRETATIGVHFSGVNPCVEKQYDNYGRLLKESLPYTGTSASLWNTYQYDNDDRLISINEASGRTTTYSFNGNSVTTTRDGIASTQTFDAQGNLIQVTDPAGTITYNYRPDRRPSSIVAPGSITTSFTYDNYGRRQTVVDPSAGTQTYTYDIHGNLETETDANNRQF